MASSTKTTASTLVRASGESAFVLSPEQEKVVYHRGGHLQVIACAGAGKTEATSRRVSTLIEEGVEPAQIIAFTFTERAAASLKTRITRRIAQVKGTAFLDRLGPMFVGTIHAYCLHMLQDHVPEFCKHAKRGKHDSRWRESRPQTTWEIELYAGNDPKWLNQHKRALLAHIQDDFGCPHVTSIRIVGTK